MLDRRAFLLSGLAAYGVSARELFAAGPALQNPEVSDLAVHARRVLRRSGARRCRPLDAACARSVERRRHAAPADRRAVAGRDRRPHVDASCVGNGDGVARLGALGSRRSRRAAAAPLVLVPVPRRQRDEPHRPHAHISARAVGRRSAPVRDRLVPAFRGRPVHGLPAHGRGRSRSRAAPRRLHLRKPGPRQAGAQARRRRAADASTTTAIATRSTAAIRRCAPRTPPFPFLVVWDDHEVDNNYAGPERRERNAGRAVRLAPCGRLQGLLRAHAAAPRVDSEGRAAAALSAASRTGRLPAFRCSTRGSTAPTSRAATTCSCHARL